MAVGSLGAFLGAIAGPLAKRVLTAVGVGVVSYVGFSAAIDGALSAARSAWSGGLVGDVGAYMAMCGANTGLSVIAGAIVARVALVATKRLASL